MPLPRVAIIVQTLHKVQENISVAENLLEDAEDDVTTEEGAIAAERVAVALIQSAAALTAAAEQCRIAYHHAMQATDLLDNN